MTDHWSPCIASFRLKEHNSQDRAVTLGARTGLDLREGCSNLMTSRNLESFEIKMPNVCGVGISKLNFKNKCRFQIFCNSKTVVSNIY